MAINWSDPTTIGITLAIVVVLGAAGYAYYAYTQKAWPFGR